MENVPQMRRFLLYAHDGPRLGRARRALSIVGALTARDDASILLVTGADEVSSLGLPSHVGVLRLPGPSQPEDSPLAGEHLLRQKLLAAATETFRPDVVLVDTDPFGDSGELGPSLEIARAAGGRTVLGLPDVVDERPAIDLEWRNRGLFERIPDYYDRVLVYGQPDLLDPILDCGFPDDVARLTAFCGYVVSSPRPEPSSRRPGRPARPRVLATAGGGDEGSELLEAFVDAASEAPWQATVVAGPRCPQERVEALRGLAAGAGVTFRRFVPSLFSELSAADALVCTGGYNTLVEAAASGVPTVCVPRAAPARDQVLRARAFAARGLARLIEPDVLEPGLLRAKIEAALAAGAPPRTAALDVGGDRRAAHYLLELASRRATRATRTLVA
jgi:predicted glycosyltransferase